MYKMIVSKLSKLSTASLVAIPIILSLAPIAVNHWISGGRYTGKPVEDALILLIMFLWGLSGLPMILRKEAPGLIWLHGVPAIIQGIFISVSFWGILVLLLIFMVRKH